MKGLNIQDKNIIYFRKIIKETLIEDFNIYDNNNLHIITVELINQLIKLYDYYILDGFIQEYIKNGIKTSLSKKMTSAGGKTIFLNNKNIKEFEIRISLAILEKYALSNCKGKICGIEGQDILDGLMLIIEHELCHVLEFAVYDTSSCKGHRFKKIAWKLFRHSATTHDVLNKLESDSLITVKVGQNVYFEYHGKIHTGIVSNITKRATVMVLDSKGRYKDKHGNTYNKWYVPLKMLKVE